MTGRRHWPTTLRQSLRPWAGKDDSHVSRVLPCRVRCCAGQVQAVWERALLSLGHDEVSQHVKGVAIWMHRHNLTTLLVDLQEPGIIKPHD